MFRNTSKYFINHNNVPAKNGAVVIAKLIEKKEANRNLFAITLTLILLTAIVLQFNFASSVSGASPITSPITAPITSPEISPSPTQSPLPTSSSTPTPSATPSSTAQPTTTPAPTFSPSPSASPSASVTPKPSATPSPSSTPKPKTKISKVLKKIIKIILSVFNFRV